MSAAMPSGVPSKARIIEAGGSANSYDPETTTSSEIGATATMMT
nr:hypothetical protein [Rhizobium sp. ACO-34A]